MTAASMASTTWRMDDDGRIEQVLSSLPKAVVAKRLRRGFLCASDVVLAYHSHDEVRLDPV